MLADLARLDMMSPSELRGEWERLHGSAAPGIAPALLIQGIAYRVQLQASGQAEVSLARMLGRKSRPALKAGTQLIRSWNGRTIMVTAVDDGFLFEDELYHSLSAIERHVKGAHWSGPRFFGLVDHG